MSEDKLFSSLFSLRGRHALVTGGGSGIGKLVAETLAAAGAKVTIAGRNMEKLNKAAAAIAVGCKERGEGGATKCDVDCMTCDVTDLPAVAGFVREVSARRGDIDILVNGAGDNPRLPLAQITPDKWREVLDVNLSSVFFLAQAAAPAMVARGWGRILNIASLQSRLAFVNGASYGAAKGGVAQLTRAMAREWSSHGVTANALAPGFFPTQMTAAVLQKNPQSAAYLSSRTAIGRNGELPDLRGAALLLTSPAGEYITGQVLFVDGGFTAM